MNNRRSWQRIGTALLGSVGLLMVTSQAAAVEYSLRADEVQVTMPDGEQVTLWGYAFGAGAATVPGPVLTVPAGDTQLVINLQNDLPEPISIVIHGQTAVMTPVMVGNRVRSFTHETAPGSTGRYEWNDVQPGTYLYQSGTRPAIQVPMGLYGAMTKDHSTAPREAYAGIGYDSDVLPLLFSEVDPLLSAAVVSGAYGTPAYPSTINYAPRYFLINGAPYEITDPPAAPIAAGAVGQRVLLRFLNAGLKTHVPVLQGTHISLVAEDGKPYPYSRTQYSVFLPAAKTVDAILEPTSSGGDPPVYPLYDRRLDVANPVAGGGQVAGGMMAFLAAGPSSGGNTQPMITSTPGTSATQGQVYTYQLTATDAEGGVLGYSLSVAPAGMGIDSAGLISWTPSSSQVGDHAVSAQVQDSGGLFATQSYTVTVANVNDAPTAQADAYSMSQGGVLTVAAPGVLDNDQDIDGDALTASLMSNPGNGVLNLNADGGFTYTPIASFTGTDSFSYQAYDGALNSAPVTVQVMVNLNQAPVAVDDRFRTNRNVAVVIAALANDYDTDGSLDPATVLITTTPTKGGTVIVNANGTVNYTPRNNFAGTDIFRYQVKDNLGKLSNIATVRVNVVR